MKESYGGFDLHGHTKEAVIKAKEVGLTGNLFYRIDPSTSSGFILSERSKTKY